MLVLVLALSFRGGVNAPCVFLFFNKYTNKYRTLLRVRFSLLQYFLPIRLLSNLDSGQMNLKRDRISS